MILGYARVSTGERNLDAQLDSLRQAGAGCIFAGKISGSLRNRPELDQLRDGDVVVVTKYDRLARSLKDLLGIVEAIRARGAGFRSLAEDIRHHHACGSARVPRLRLHRAVQAGADLRAHAGRAGDRAQAGQGGGRPSALSPAQKEAHRMCDGERRPLSEITALFRVSVQTMRRA